MFARHTALGDNHLSTLLSAYVDLQLNEVDTNCVEGHLLVCQECASAVEEIRRVRGILAAPPIIDPSEKLIEKLALIERIDVSTETGPTVRIWPRRALVAALGIAASLVLLTVVGTYELPRVSGNVAQRAQNSLLDNRARVANFMVATNGETSAPDLAPQLRSLSNANSDLEVLSVQREDERDEYEVIMRMETSQIVVRDRRGRLPAGDAAPGRKTQISGHEVQVISDAPWTAVWQRGERVVSVAADAPYDTIALVIDSIPPEPLDEGISARVMRGVHQIGQVIGH